MSETDEPLVQYVVADRAERPLSEDFREFARAFVETRPAAPFKGR